MSTSKCVRPDCRAARFSRGLCRRCYNRHYHAGTLADVSLPCAARASERSIRSTYRRPVTNRPRGFRPIKGVSVRAVRGPDDRGRWYWQATAYDPATRKRPTVWSGWASEDDVRALLPDIVGSAGGPKFEPPAPMFKQLDPRNIPRGNHVYAISIGRKYVKVGVSRNVARRFSEIQMSNPFPLSLVAVMPGWVREERRIHDAHKALHVRGEWFVFHDDIIAEFAASQQSAALARS